MGGRLEKVKGHPGIYKVVDGTGEWKGAYKTSYRVNGRQRWKTFSPPDALRSAEAFRAAVSTRKAEGTLIDPRKGRVTIAALYGELHANRSYAPATLAIHDECWKKIEPLLGHRSVNQIDSGTIEALLQELLATPMMQQKVRALLSVLFNRAVDQKLIASSPVSKASRGTTRAERKARGANSERKRRILSDDELNRLYDAIAPRYRAIIILMGRMGLRPGEALALTVGKFWLPAEAPEEKPGRLLIDTAIAGDTKTGESRELVLPDSVARGLAHHIARFSDEKDPKAPIFSTEDGRAIRTKNAYDAWVRRHFKPASFRAGVNPGLSPNDLRHTAAAWAISLGGTVYDVQRMLGHAKPSMTLDIYGSLWEQKHADLVRRQDEALRRIEAAVPHSLEGRLKSSESRDGVSMET